MKLDARSEGLMILIFLADFVSRSYLYIFVANSEAVLVDRRFAWISTISLSFH